MFGDFNLGVYILASVTLFVDLIDVLVRLYLRREHTVPGTRRTAPTSVPLDVGEFTPYEVSLHIRPYAVVAAVHNLDREALDDFIASVRAYTDRLWIIDDASTDDTWERLKAAGVRAIQSNHNRKKPGAIKALLAELPAEITTVLVMDPDARILSDKADFERVLFEFQRSEMAAACPRICIRRAGLLSRFQQLEYSFSFSIGRKSLADFTVTSGIALYRRDALARLLERHTLSVYAEDLENAMLLLLAGERVYYDGRLIVQTDGMESLRTLCSQRVGWNFGLIKVYAEHWWRLLRESRRGVAFTYQYVVYMGVLTLLFHPIKVAGTFVLALSALNGVDNLLGLGLVRDTALTSEIYAYVMYLKYTALALAITPLAVRRADRRDVLPIVPLYMFYAVGQIVPTTLGYLNWFSLRAWGRRIYHDHYQPASP